MKQDFAARYGDFESWHWWFQGRERILASAIVRELAAAPPGAAGPRLATVGCGPPEGLAWLTSLAGPRGRVVGLDADPSGAIRELLAERAEPGAKGVDYVFGRVERAPLRPACCDAVLALDVIEHIDDDDAALASLAPLVRPGGFLMVTVPALPSLWGNQDEVSDHKRRYTARTLRRAFERAQLPIPRITYFNTLLFPAIAGIRWMRRLLGRGDDGTSDFDRGRPGGVNDLLTRVFASERHLLGRLRLPIGVSLLAVSRFAGEEDA